MRRSKLPPRKNLQILGEAALKTNSRVGYGRHFRVPAVDAARDGSGARAKGPYPSGTGITRSSNETRPSRGSPWPSSPSFSTHVRDLASQMQLAWQPVPSQDALPVARALEDLFREHGPPLVIKSDNGSAFIAQEVRSLLKRWNVVQLFSPPRTPRYNGSCEAAGGAMKAQTQHQAILRDCPGSWTSRDLAVARSIRNPLGAAERAAFGRTLQRLQPAALAELGYSPDDRLGRNAQARVNRLAISRTLVECGILSFTQRSITPPIHSQKELGVS